MGQTEGQVARIVVHASAPVHPALSNALRVAGKFQVVQEPDARRAAELVRAGDVDVLVAFAPAAGDAAALAGNFSATLTFDASKERSAAARDRVASTIETFREDWLEREAKARSVPTAAWGAFTLADRDVSTGRQIGARILSLMLPLFFVIMVAVGCFYPAIDATAGERERGTWETMLTLSVPRTRVVLAKYLSVATLGCLAGLINLAAMLAHHPPDPRAARSRAPASGSSSPCRRGACRSCCSARCSSPASSPPA